MCRRGKEGFSKSRAKEGKTRQERREQEWRRGQVSAFHLDIQDDRSGARKPLSLTGRDALQAEEGSAVR